MAGYNPLKIAGFESGLVQEREDFLLVEDAFPTMQNAYIWREKILKKRGKENFGRLRRVLPSESLSATAASDTYTDTDIFTTILLRATEPDATLQCLGFEITFGIGGGNETILEDTTGDGTLATTATNALGATGGTINYATGAITVSFAAPIAGGIAVEADFAYYPGLPVMGLKTRELLQVSPEDVIAFDTKYAYEHTSSAWQELLVGTTWGGTDTDFFWTTNYWVDATNNKLFWATNFTSGVSGDPIRYYNGTIWTDFAPLITSADTLFQARIILPFRGRLLALNTFEGTTGGGIAGATQQPQRIRWSQIGTPIDAESFRGDIRGKGSFLDIPTSEQIVSAGFVRDNLVIYCERSTWQLRYVGRDISPFQIERVNTELGAESTFSTIQFDKSLVGIGDKRIVSCDSFDATPIDIKIPDFAINIENDNFGHKRVHGIRDIQKRLTYWTYPGVSGEDYDAKFPSRVLLYNYENESWAILKDSITTYGFVWIENDPTWEEMGDVTWEQNDTTWAGEQAQEPIIIGGNQQGYVHKMNTLTSNDPSLQIVGITGNVTSATELSCPEHNLEGGDIIEIRNIPDGTGFASSLNGNIFSVTPTDEDTLEIFTYDAGTDSWITPQLDAAATYVGCGEIVIRDNFSLITKKFNHMDEGQKIQIGYIDALLSKTDAGELVLKFYVDYQNSIQTNLGDDSFFNTAIPTTENDLDIPGASNYWHRIFCSVRGNFLQAEFTLSNSQMNGQAAISEVVLHALVLWERQAGRLTI